MNTFVRMLSFLVAVGASALDAQAQDKATSAPLPDPKAGDTWTYVETDLFTKLETGRSSMEFRSRDPSGLRFASTDLKTGSLSAERRNTHLGPCYANEVYTEAVCAGPYKFPLQVGNQHTYADRPLPGNPGVSESRCTVVAFEKVTVPAGTYDTFRVDCDGAYRYNSVNQLYIGRMVSAHWYAPAINGEVKSTLRVSHPKDGMLDQRQWELLSYSPAGTAAAKPAPPYPVEFPAEAETLTLESFQQRVAGKVYVGTRSDGVPLRWDIRADRTIIWQGRGPILNGTWRLEDGRFCADLRGASDNSCNDVRFKDGTFFYKRQVNGEVVAMKAQ